jgi:hypothetical protein
MKKNELLNEYYYTPSPASPLSILYHTIAGYSFFSEVEALLSDLAYIWSKDY